MRYHHVVASGEKLVSVLEARTFSRTADKLLTAAERADVILLLASNPECGDLVEGTGGVRKVRIPLAGRGKSAGARVYYYYYDPSLPLLAIAVIPKSARENISAAEKEEMRRMVRAYRG